MKKIDSFFLFILSLLLGLGVFFYLAEKELASVDKDGSLTAKVMRQKSLASLYAKLEELNTKKITTNNDRTIASIPSQSGQYGSIDTNEFVVDSPLDAEKYAKSQYLTAKASCYKEGEESVCIQKIEKIVTHFPETMWAGESLVLLIDFYYRKKENSKAQEILDVLRTQFGEVPAIKSKIAIIERHIE